MWKYLLRHAKRTTTLCLFQCFRNIKTLNHLTNTHTFEPNIDFISHSLEECTYSRDFRTGFLIHAHVIKFYYAAGFTSLWNKILNLYCKCGEFKYALHLFEKMPDRNVVSFNTMILTCIRNGYHLEALSVYSEMISGGKFKPDCITLAGLIGTRGEGLGGMKLREAFHAQAIQYGLSSNEFVGSSLIDGYAKENSLEDAIRVFHDIVEPDLVSWNIMIDGCVENSSKGHAWRIFRKMLQANVRYDGFTLTSIVKTCTDAGDLEHGMLVHCCAIKNGLAYETPISNALITMYSRCEVGMTSAMNMFGGLFAPNVISWTAMIAGFMQNGENKEAVVLYRDMLRSGIKETNFTLASILPAYSNLANLEEGKQVHARVIKLGFGLDLPVNNALIDLYSKCGCLDEAHMVFKTMGNHDRISFTTIITGLGQHGEGKNALEVLQDMLKKGIKPDDVTFLGCLHACSHGGHVNDGMHLFRVMVDVYNIKPRREHLSCVVDMLGRAGRLREAEIFMEEMGIKSDICTWESLLGACKLYGEISLGEKYAKMIIELHPERHGTYVSLANIYAENELWGNKSAMRESLTVNGSAKDAGCSRV